MSFDQFIDYIKRSNYENVSKMLKDSTFDPSQKYNMAIKIAINKGNAKIVELLLQNQKVSDTVRFYQLIDMTKDNNIINMLKREKYKIKKSPQEYKTVRKVLNLKDLSDPTITTIENKMIIRDRKVKYTTYTYEPTITVIPNIDIVNNNNEYRSFLCDMELFNWKLSNTNIETHKTRENKIAETLMYPLYTLYLGKTFGNDITIFTPNMLSTKNDRLLFEILYNSGVLIDPTVDIMNSINNYPVKYEIENAKLRDELKKQNIDYDFVFDPICIQEFIAFSKKYYKCLYCDAIVNNKKTRYSVMSCVIELNHVDDSHYTFIFVDHETKQVEFYDPHGYSMNEQTILFTHKALGMIFKDYTVNEFWKLANIQKTENLEDDEKGFCVIWGHMMMHLKLLNMNIPIIELDKLFVQECEDKKISLYEVVLNYSYFMSRIIPLENMHNFVNLWKLLNNVRNNSNN